MTEFHVFSEPDGLAEFAAARVALALGQGLADRGAASLVVPGGRTPIAFLGKLGCRSLGWARISVTLSDERWVDPLSPDSNEALVRRTLLLGPAAAARFIPLYDGAVSPAMGVAETSERIEQVPRPWDAVVLGIGEDGHFASLFPGEPALAVGLDPAAKVLCVPARGPVAGPPRLSLTLACLAATRHLFVLATGAAKREIWQAAGAARSDLPVAALRRLTAPPVEFLWCP